MILLRINDIDDPPLHPSPTFLDIDIFVNETLSLKNQLEHSYLLSISSLLKDVCLRGGVANHDLAQVLVERVTADRVEEKLLKIKEFRIVSSKFLESSQLAGCQKLSDGMMILICFFKVSLTSDLSRSEWFTEIFYYVFLTWGVLVAMLLLGGTPDSGQSTRAKLN